MAELPHQAEITGLLTKWREGDEQARDALFAAVYRSCARSPRVSCNASVGTIRSNPAPS